MVTLLIGFSLIPVIRAGEGESDFAYTGEAVDALTGYVYLRAR